MKKDPIGKQVLDAGKSTRKAFEAFYLSVCDEPLKPVAGRVFGYLAHHPEASSQDIQREFSLSKATVSECLSLLIARDYISYEKSEKDGREKTIKLTEEGYALANRHQQIVAQFDECLNQGFTEEELNTLSDLLKKVRKRTEEIAHGE